VWVADKFFFIPEELFGIFKLSDLSLVYKDNFIEAGLTPTFLPIAPHTHTQMNTFSDDLGWMIYEIDLGFVNIEIDLNQFSDYLMQIFQYV